MCLLTSSEASVPVRVVERRRYREMTRIPMPQTRRPRSPRLSEVEIVYAPSSPRQSVVSDPNISYTTIKRTHSRSRSRTLIPPERSSVGSNHHHHGHYFEVLEPDYHHHHGHHHHRHHRHGHHHHHHDLQYLGHGGESVVRFL